MSIINDIVTYSPKIQKVYKKYIIEVLSRKQAGEGGDRKFFNQYWQPFAWATTIGFIENRRIPITEAYEQDTFKYSVLANQAPDILNSLIIMAIGKFKMNTIDEEIKLLQNPDEIVKIIDEYANGGFEIIIRKIKNNPDYFYEQNIYISDLLTRK